MRQFRVAGTPVPKQSFRVNGHGGYRDPRVTAWQELVAWQGRIAMGPDPPLGGALRVRLEFVLPTKRRVDCDNLAKGVEDALNGIVWLDDHQIVSLTITKCVGASPGVTITIEEIP